MPALLLYSLLISVGLYCLYQFFYGPKSPKEKGSQRFRPKGPKQNWVQVYETASMEEAKQIQARLEEEEVECILYEQGKKDISGSPLRGVGIAVPKTTMGLAQQIISRIPV